MTNMKKKIVGKHQGAVFALCVRFGQILCREETYNRAVRIIIEPQLSKSEKCGRSTLLSYNIRRAWCIKARRTHKIGWGTRYCCSEEGEI